MSEERVAALFADAHLIAGAVRGEVERAAYLATGGSTGCAQCKSMTFRERVERGHLGCAEEMAAAKGAQSTVAGMSEVWIAISRVMEDPRFGQWIEAQR